MTVQVGAGYFPKNIPLDLLLFTLETITQKVEFSTLNLIGNKKSEETDNFVLNIARTCPNCAVHDYIQKTTLSQAIDLIETSALFVGPDSGPMHIANFFGIPVVALYSGVNNLDSWGPYFRRNALILFTGKCRSEQFNMFRPFYIGDRGCAKIDCKKSDCWKNLSKETIRNQIDKKIKKILSDTE